MMKTLNFSSEFHQILKKKLNLIKIIEGGGSNNTLVVTRVNAAKKEKMEQKRTKEAKTIQQQSEFVLTFGRNNFLFCQKEMKFRIFIWMKPTVLTEL